MSSLLTKLLGMVLLVATIGLASCQAFLLEFPTISSSVEQGE